MPSSSILWNQGPSAVMRSRRSLDLSLAEVTRIPSMSDFAFCRRLGLLHPSGAAAALRPVGQTCAEIASWLAQPRQLGLADAPAWPALRARPPHSARSTAPGL